jgi:peptidoglycan/xylan/chitin deacetylase (PgdA/CDA1 family)
MARMAVVRIAALLASLLAAGVAHGARTVAVTFDDLPGPPGSLVGSDVKTLRQTTRKLLSALRDERIPVVGFVNEGKLFVEGEPPARADERIAVLSMWLDAGHELGNHTYSHRSLNKTPLEEFQEDVVRGEIVTRRLLAPRGARLRYFRHPFLQVGLELDKRRAFESYLNERGYTIAPVTIDNDEYMYAFVYADMLRRGDRAAADRLAVDYLRYMESVLVFFEQVSRTLLGREIPQVLLLHANSLNADHFGRLAEIMKARGYRFVTLEKVLEDEAYRRPDTYVGGWGISWLHHWEITEGRERTPSPDLPEWVTKAYEGLSR